MKTHFLVKKIISVNGLFKKRGNPIIKNPDFIPPVLKIFPASRTGIKIYSILADLMAKIIYLI
jgi:hypothetical protein